jgi:hypothetical protein
MNIFPIIIMKLILLVVIFFWVSMLFFESNKRLDSIEREISIIKNILMEDFNSNS